MSGNGPVDIWTMIASGIERDGDRAARSHLDAGFPIYVANADTPDGTVVRIDPDGSRRLVRFDGAGEHRLR
ncbi:MULTISPECIES: T-complex 10 C-terminal domain-containing protein [Alphaproteobacteria]|mgnify:CR=1 FL=1|jgi:hypothetical protein|nr:MULTISPECIES: T-complex 10 C-terminal domain-containing protein [Alphaproteobacteria]QPS18540.1 hypothetical protein I6G65_20300 [Sphingomonas paucimobilis]